jgi:hypothetical protein
MSDILPVIETLENRWMRAWIGRDARELKALTSTNFRMVVGSKPSVILDAPSWIEAASSRYRCSAYRFGDMYARDLGSVVVFATHLHLEAAIDGHDFSGETWITDLWRKTRIRRKWKMVERMVSQPHDDGRISAAVRSLQLWR